MSGLLKALLISMLYALGAGVVLGLFVSMIHLPPALAVLIGMPVGAAAQIYGFWKHYPA